MTSPAPLAEALEAAGWGPRDLGRAVNAWLVGHGRGHDRIDVTAVYPWVRSGYCPHGSIPEVVATVLTEQLGHYVSAEQLWPGHSRARRTTQRASDLSRMRSMDDVVRALGELATGMRPLPTDGPDLVAAVLDGVESIVEPSTGRHRSERVMSGQAELIAQHVGALRHLDDQQGGGALSLRYVTHELAGVLDLVRSATYDPAVGRQLLTAVADLAQLAGWMQFHAGQTATAQPYLLLAARVARAAGDDGRLINTIGMLAYTASYSSNAATAIQIVEVAERVPTSSALLQARTAGRAATAYAAAGDLAAFQAASDRAQHLLTTAERDDAAAYLYYLTADQLYAEAGHGLVAVAMRTDLYQRRLLRRAVDLLAPLSGADARPEYQRSALLHGCHLARAQLMLRELDGAIETIRIALARLPEVQSGLCTSMLRDVRRDLARRARSTAVAEFLPEFDEALQTL